MYARHEIMQELSWSYMDANGSDESATQLFTTLLPSSCCHDATLAPLPHNKALTRILAKMAALVMLCKVFERAAAPASMLRYCILHDRVWYLCKPCAQSRRHSRSSFVGTLTLSPPRAPLNRSGEACHH